MPAPENLYDAFISHSSANRDIANGVAKELDRAGLKFWLDDSDNVAGSLLRNQLHTALESARVFLLVWSKPAAASRWVLSEILTAFHLDRRIIPYVLDDAAPLPPFLENSTYLQASKTPLDRLPAIVRRSPSGAGELPPFFPSASAELNEAIDVLGRAQQLVTDPLMRREVGEARDAQTRLDKTQKLAEKRWPFEAMILNLGGYHRKNGYIIEHWDEIMAGRPPKVPLLREAERLFFESLLVNPVDYNALNGLASILIYERELEAASFFNDRALDLAARAGIQYGAAQHDRELIKSLRARSR